MTLKQRIRQFRRMPLSVACRVIIFSGFALLSPLPAGAADSINLTLNYTVMQGTCSVNVQTDSGSSLKFGDVVAVKKTSNWQPMALSGGATYKTFNVQLTNCSGSAVATTTPGLTLSGPTLSNDGTNNKQYLFVNQGASTAKGLGFVIYNSDKPSPGTNEVSGDPSASQYYYIPVPGYGKGTALSGTVVVPLSAAVTCGKTCTNSSYPMTAGTLNGSVTFSFLYH